MVRAKRASIEAVSYLRCSGMGQLDGDTWARQAKATQRYASANNMVVVNEFRDAGVSGVKDAQNRPGLNSLIDFIKSNGLRVVLIENATRLARDLMVSETILQQLTALGCKVVAADSGIDLTADDPAIRLIRQVLGAVAEFDCRETVLKLRAARERLRGHGKKCEGRKPFGSRLGEQNTLVRIMELYRKPRGRKRRSLQQICDLLNAEGVATRTGKPWTKQVISRITKRTGQEPHTDRRTTFPSG